MRRMMTLLTTAAMALTSQLAIAQGMGMGPPSFGSLDADSSGELSAEEIAALPFVQGGRATAEQILTQWDTDSNGRVSEEEFNNRPAMGMGMAMGAMGMGG